MPQATATGDALNRLLKPKVISYSINERYDRVVVLNTGEVYLSRSKGVNGNNYNPWEKWDILGEIKRDTE